jgi:hypothetical protein
VRRVRDDAPSVAQHHWTAAEKFQGVSTIDPTSDRLAVVVAADGSQLLTGHCPIEVKSRIELELHP